MIIMNNYLLQSLQYIRDVSSLTFGTCAGIMKLESLYGFGFFLVTYLITGLLFYIIFAGGAKEANKFYESPISTIFIGDIGTYLASFTMMWCLLSAFVSA